MKKSAKFFGFKTLSLFVFFCFSVISGVGLGTEPAHAATYDPNVEYKISNQHSGRVLDVAYQSTSDGGNIHQWHYKGQTSQKWKIQSTGDGYYKIVNVNSGKVVDIKGPSTGNGANVHQWTDLGTDSQKWSIQDVGNGYSKIISKYSGKALDVQFLSIDNGGNVHQWDYLGNDNQHWKIEDANQAQVMPQPFKYYRIVNDATGRSLTVTGSSTSDDAIVTVENYANKDNQKFVFQSLGNGRYNIVAKHSGKGIHEKVTGYSPGYFELNQSNPLFSLQWNVGTTNYPGTYNAFVLSTVAQNTSLWLKENDGQDTPPIAPLYITLNYKRGYENWRLEVVE